MPLTLGACQPSADDGESVTTLPSEALQDLGENYVPTERRCQFVIAINGETGRRF